MLKYQFQTFCTFMDVKTYKKRERDTDQCIQFEIQAGIEPSIPIHLAYSIDSKALS